MSIAEENLESDILTRAMGDVAGATSPFLSPGFGARWAARRLKTVAHEELLILDVPLSAAAERVNAGLPVRKHPLLSDQYLTVEPHAVRWICGGGRFKLDPVVVTVSLASAPYGTTLKVRGAAKEGTPRRRTAFWLVDELIGLISDFFEGWEVIDIIDRQDDPAFALHEATRT